MDRELTVLPKNLSTQALTAGEETTPPEATHSPVALIELTAQATAYRRRLPGSPAKLIA